jgi:hypothetical protein
VISATTPIGRRLVETSAPVADCSKCSPTERYASLAAKRRICAARAASPRASRSGLPISVVMSRATCSARASSTAAAALRYAARRAIGRAAHEGNAASAAAAAASASASLDDENSPTVSDGRIGFTFVYVSPDAAGTHAPPT